jgi:aryl-alcohol dehydrogenase-like predicted oxidoreductase
MKIRRMGSTGLRVSEVGFGAWQLGNRKVPQIKRQSNLFTKL